MVFADASKAQVDAALADVRRILETAPKDKPANKLLAVLIAKEEAEAGGDASKAAE